MTTRGTRTLTLVGAVAWLIVAGYGVRSVVVEDDRGWELTYTVFSVALLVGVAASVRIATLATRQSGRPRLRMVGVVISGLGGVAALVAWALPLWMTILGLGSRCSPSHRDPTSAERWHSWPPDSWSGWR